MKVRYKQQESIMTTDGGNKDAILRVTRAEQ